MRILSIFFASLLFFVSCSSSTVIQSEPSGASVYIENQKKGVTPYTYSDTKIVGSSTQITLKKEGYEDMDVVLIRNEEADIGAIVAGVFFLVPFLWTMKYDPSAHIYELTENGNGNVSIQPTSDETSTSSSTSNSTTELIKLKNLLDQGAITQDDFTTLKVKILNEEYDYKNSIADQIIKLKELKDADLLTIDEFNSQVNKLVNGNN